MAVRPPWWAVVSSAAAPVFLVGGWAVAQLAQPSGYDPVDETISALARTGLDHRWIMTVGLAGLGLAHLTTAAGLRGVRRGSRGVLAAGGLATVAVAVFPQPAHGSSAAHLVAATIGFVALALWPVTTSRSGRGVPTAVRVPVALGATVASSALLVWLAVTLAAGPLGVSERLLTGQQALWPLVVVLSLRRTPRPTRDVEGGDDRIDA